MGKNKKKNGKNKKNRSKKKRKISKSLKKYQWIIHPKNLQHSHYYPKFP